MQSQNIRALRLLAAGLMTSSLLACFQTRDTTLPMSPAQLKSVQGSASDARGNHQEAKPPRYTIVDLGTLGGSMSAATGLNNRGWLAGSSTTPGDGYEHAFLWRKGVMTDVGRSFGSLNSFTSDAAPINDAGAITSFYITNTPDPYGEVFCSGVPGSASDICLPFIWRNGRATMLPLPGGHNGLPNQINNRGEIAGTGEEGRPDETCVPPQVLDQVAVVWGPKNEAIRKLPPYGNDTQASAFGINDKGEVVGTSGKCKFFLRSFGYIEAILWRNGRPINLGNLGGRLFNIGFSINNKSEVTGQASTSGSHGFHTFLWRNGKMSDLGTLPGDRISLGNSINDRTQIVGLSFPPGSSTMHGFLWQRGVMYDLNTLIPAHSDIIVLEALGINARGQIAGWGLDRNASALSGFLATPCDGQNPDHKGCEDARGAGSSVPLPQNVRQTLIRWNALHHIHLQPETGGPTNE